MLCKSDKPSIIIIILIAFQEHWRLTEKVVTGLAVDWVVVTGVAEGAMAAQAVG